MQPMKHAASYDAMVNLKMHHLCREMLRATVIRKISLNVDYLASMESTYCVLSYKCRNRSSSTVSSSPFSCLYLFILSFTNPQIIFLCQRHLKFSHAGFYALDFCAFLSTKVYKQIFFFPFFRILFYASRFPLLRKYFPMRSTSRRLFFRRNEEKSIVIFCVEFPMTISFCQILLDTIVVSFWFHN